VTLRPTPRLCPETGKVGVCKDQSKAWINALEESEKAKNAAGLVQEQDNEMCRGKQRKPTS